jgi:hypothetical protein
MLDGLRIDHLTGRAIQMATFNGYAISPDTWI